MPVAANPTLTVIKPNQRKLMIASRDLKHRADLEKTPEISR